MHKFSENLSFTMSETPLSFQHSSPDVLHCLSLTYLVGWPLNIILSHEALLRYAKVFQFLVKMRRISWVLGEDFEVSFYFYIFYTIRMCVKTKNKMLFSPLSFSSEAKMSVPIYFCFVDRGNAIQILFNTFHIIHIVMSRSVPQITVTMLLSHIGTMFPFQSLKLAAKLSRQESRKLLRSPQYISTQLYRHIMASLIRALDNYIVTTCILTSWTEFENDLKKARTLDDLYDCHVVYIKKVLFRCLLNNRSTPVMKLLNDIFIVILKFSRVLNAG